MTLHKLTSLGLLLFAFSGAIAACSSDSDDPATPGQSSTPSTTRVSAKDGGTVTDATGTVTLSIPAGALAEDTDITLAVGAATSATIASVYDFGPDGLTFLTPATLTIKVDASTVGDKEVAVAIEEGGKFVALAGSTYADGVATAKVEHFSKFSVVFVDGKAVDNACEDAKANFQACGGDIKGTWVVEEFCYAGAIEGPLDDCAQQEVSLELLHEGLEYTFGEDGTFSATAGTETQKLSVVAPLSCFGAPSCESISASEESLECSGSDVCSCTKTEVKPREAEQGTYTTDGGTLTITTDDEPDVHEYCVQGDVAHVVVNDDDDQISMLVRFKRK